jgi:predicted MFS family arabinose efflux permease
MGRCFFSHGVMTSNDQRRGLRGPLAHRDYRYLLGGLVISGTGDWLYNVALVVFVLERTGSAAWVSIAAVCKLAPYVVLGPYGGALADRYDRRTLMIGSDLIRAALMIALAALAAFDGPAGAAVAIAAASTAAAVPYLPAVGALTPTLVGDEDLAAANALTGMVDNITIAVGPALGGLVLLVGGAPAVAFALNASTFIASALLVSRLRDLPKPEASDAENPLRRRLAAGFQALGSSTQLILLVALGMAFTITFGQEFVLYPLVASRRLGWGPEGVGFLLAASGVGGILGAGFLSRLSGTRRPAPVLVISLLIAAVPMLLMAVTREIAVILPFLLAEGAAVIVADVVSTTTIQRVAPPGTVGRVFGIMSSLFVGGTLVGAIIAPITVGALGLTAALATGGAFLVVSTLVAIPGARSLDRAAAARADELADRVALLSGLRIFEGATTQGLEALAGAMERRQVPSGERMISEGDAADAFYVVEGGTLAVSMHGVPVSTLGAGAYFGEIGVLEGVPRTATVTTTSECFLFRIDADLFIEAVGSAPVGARTLAETMTGRLARTHPGRRVDFTPSEQES